MQAGLTKLQFFEMFPNFNYRKDSFPKVLIDKIKIKRQLKERHLKQAYKDLIYPLYSIELFCVC